MNYWIFKSEPDTFSIDDLSSRKKEIWDGVRNYQARNFLRDNTEVGDLVYFYHSSCEVPAIAGLARISKTKVVDPSQFLPDSKYYDPKSTLENPRWITVEVEFIEKYKNPITREDLKSKESLEEMVLMKRGNRLSIINISEKEFKEILKLKK